GRVPTASTGLAAFIEAAKRERPDLDAVAVAFAGQVHDGVILSAPNISVDEPQIEAWAEAKLGIALKIENDLNCAALAEALHYGSDSLVALYAGTGLGAGIVERGAVCHGFRSLAGEIGHVPYRQAPFRCGCGKSNCLELWASGSGLEKWSRHLGCGEGADLRRLAEAADSRCRSLADDFIEALLHATATLVTLCNCEVMVLGGGVVAHNPWLVERVKERLKNYALAASLEGLRIVGSELQEAPLQGAKLLLDTI
ncbi:ROK family protein, partial [Hydrogenimonas sp.]